MELLDIVDDNNHLKGKAVDRDIVHKEGLWHREVGVIILNENNEILLEKRSPNKKQSPNKWAIVAGHIEAGDVPEKAIVREIKEEIGIDVTINDLEFMMIGRRDKKFSNLQNNKTFIYIYLLRTKKKIDEYIIQEEELTEVRYFKLKDLEDAIRIKDQEFAFSDEEYIKSVCKNIKQRICKI